MPSRYSHIQEDVAVQVGKVVAIAVPVVGHHVQAPGVKDLVELLNGLGALGPGDGALDNRASRLIGEEGLRSILAGGKGGGRTGNGTLGAGPQGVGNAKSGRHFGSWSWG